jgi:hypothetical protein
VSCHWHILILKESAVKGKQYKALNVNEQQQMMNKKQFACNFLPKLFCWNSYYELICIIKERDFLSTSWHEYENIIIVKLGKDENTVHDK